MDVCTDDDEPARKTVCKVQLRAHLPLAVQIARVRTYLVIRDPNQSTHRVVPRGENKDDGHLRRRDVRCSYGVRKDVRPVHRGKQ